METNTNTIDMKTAFKDAVNAAGSKFRDMLSRIAHYTLESKNVQTEEEKNQLRAKYFGENGAKAMSIVTEVGNAAKSMAKPHLDRLKEAFYKLGTEDYVVPGSEQQQQSDSMQP